MKNQKSDGVSGKGFLGSIENVGEKTRKLLLPLLLLLLGERVGTRSAILSL